MLSDMDISWISLYRSSRKEQTCYHPYLSSVDYRMTTK